MTNINEVKKEMHKLNQQINKLMQMTKYNDCENLEDVEINKLNADDNQLLNEYNRIFQKLELIQNNLNYLERPIKFEDTLILNKDRRYQTSNGIKTYTSGDTIEFSYLGKVFNYDTQTFSDVPIWVTSSIEHDDETQRYYIVGHMDTDLYNLKVRVR